MHDIIYIPTVLRRKKSILISRNIFFHEQAVYKNGSKMEKGLLDKVK